MVINKLISDNIVTYWEYIKYAAISAAGLQQSSYVEKFSTKLLINLLSNKYQCWIGVSDNGEQIIGVAITTIQKNVGDISDLLVDTLYTYEIGSLKEQLNFVDTIKKFGEELGCQNILFYTNNLGIIKIAEKFNFVESFRVFRLKVGEV